jgi:hypothetical protein
VEENAGADVSIAAGRPGCTLLKLIPLHLWLACRCCIVESGAGKCKATGVDNVGTVPAALTTYLAIQALKPDLVISTGEQAVRRHERVQARAAGTAPLQLCSAA